MRNKAHAKNEKGDSGHQNWGERPRAPYATWIGVFIAVLLAILGFAFFLGRLVERLDSRPHLPVQPTPNTTIILNPPATPGTGLQNTPAPPPPDGTKDTIETRAPVFIANDREEFLTEIESIGRENPFEAAKRVHDDSTFLNNYDKDAKYATMIDKLIKSTEAEANQAAIRENLRQALEILGWIRDEAKKSEQATRIKDASKRANFAVPPVRNSDTCLVRIEEVFSPTGWLGDGQEGSKYISFDGACTSDPHSGPACTRIIYTFGPLGWAGVYWQNKPDNWGASPGNDYSAKEIRRLSFWARGETGIEVVEFKAGNNNTDPKMPYKDTFSGTTGKVTLSKEWKQYSIDLENKDLSCVIGGFCWLASSDSNGRPGVTFYLDDIIFE